MLEREIGLACLPGVAEERLVEGKPFRSSVRRKDGFELPPDRHASEAEANAAAYEFIRALQ